MQVLNLYRYVNILSIDVAVGAVICAAYFADIFHAAVLPQGLAALGLAVWIIYTADHLLDAEKLAGKAATQRHQFHQNHFRKLRAVLIIAVLIEFSLIFFLKQQVFISGIVLSILVVIYTLINRWLPYAKELLAALIYCCGVLLPAVALKNGALTLTDFVVLIPFALIVLTNLVLFSWMDFEQDIKDRHQSLTTQLGKKNVSTMIMLLLTANISLIAITNNLLGFELTAVYLLMVIMLFTIFYFDHFFKKFDRFRFFGDGIFLLPAFHFLL